MKILHYPYNKEVLSFCITQVNFYDKNSKIYTQDGIAMESPLGSTRSNYFLYHVKIVVFNSPSKPTLYVDVILYQRKP